MLDAWIIQNIERERREREEQERPVLHTPAPEPPLRDEVEVPESEHKPSDFEVNFEV